MRTKKTEQAVSVAGSEYVAVEVVVDEVVCRVELSPATARWYAREARRRGVTVADLLGEAARSVLADRGRLN